MSAPVFTPWVPDWALESSHKPRVLSIQYGDGYMQRTADGLNADLPTWNVQFTQLPATAAAIMAFLITQAGVTAFQWQSPEDASPQLYICRDYKQKAETYGKYVVTCTFERVVA